MSGDEVLDATISGTLLSVLASHLQSIPAGVDLTVASLSDLGLDSMSAIELVVAIEDTFGTQFPDETLVRETFATFTSLETVVRSMVLPS
jgi:acyl carrier protein